MAKEELIKNIKAFEKDLNKIFVKANGTEIQGRIWLHIAEAKLILELQDHIDTDWIRKFYHNLLDNFMEIISINTKKHYWND